MILKEAKNLTNNHAIKRWFLTLPTCDKEIRCFPITHAADHRQEHKKDNIVLHYLSQKYSTCHLPIQLLFQISATNLISQHRINAIEQI